MDKIKFNEDKMIKLCNEIGIRVVERETNPSFFDNEKNISMSDMFDEIIVIEN